MKKLSANTEKTAVTKSSRSTHTQSMEERGGLSKKTARGHGTRNPAKKMPLAGIEPATTLLVGEE